MKNLAESLGINLAWMWAIVLLVVILITGGLTRAIFFTFVDSHEIGYEFNKTTGTTIVLDRTGYFFVKPFVTSVHSIDGRPMQVRIEANNRVLNAKLVRFRNSKAGVLQFVQMHGRQDYDQLALADILKSYAYENYSGEGYNKEELERKYAFLEILSTGTNATPIKATTDSTSIANKP